MIKAVIFDLGNVIFLPHGHEKKKALLANHLDGNAKAPDFEEFLAIYSEHRLEFDRGATTIEEYWTKVLGQAELPQSEAIIKSFINSDLQDWTMINMDVLSWHGTLRKGGYKTAVLSNLPEWFGNFYRNNFSWLNAFDTLIFSCDVKIIKPEPEIYSICLKNLGVDPEEALFFDDMEININGAKQIGINAELFISAERTIPQAAIKYSLPHNIPLTASHRKGPN